MLVPELAVTLPATSPVTAPVCTPAVLPVTLPVTAPAIGPTKLVAVTVVPTTVEAAEAPICAPSTVPPFMSTVAATRPVNVPPAGVAAPIATLSILPEFISMPVTGVVPPSRLSVFNQFELSLAPQVSSLAPTSGLT